MDITIYTCGWTFRLLFGHSHKEQDLWSQANLSLNPNLATLADKSYIDFSKSQFSLIFRGANKRIYLLGFIDMKEGIYIEHLAQSLEHSKHC